MTPYVPAVSLSIRLSGVLAICAFLLQTALLQTASAQDFPISLQAVIRKI